MTGLTLALDAMGGDFGPCITVPAALQALALIPSLSLLIVGDPAVISSYLNNVDDRLRERLQIVSASGVIASDAKPSYAIRHSRDTSMRVALELVKNGQAQAVVSAGNTGALMGLATLLLKPLAGIERPALMTQMPNQNKGSTIVLDLGANVESNATMLVQFAVMGAVMAEEIVGIKTPRVALLNIGTEASKGIESIRDAAEILQATSTINYIGYVEGNDLLTGKTDVFVCDGFAGNVALKTMEGVIRMFLSFLKPSEKSTVRQHWLSRFGYKLIIKFAKKRLMKHFSHLNPDHYNGACLVGLRGIVIKSHGGANQNAFAFSIKQAVQAVQARIPERIAMRLESVLPKSD